MEEANLKESNRHGNPSKSSRHATLSSSTFRLTGPSSLLVRTQGAVRPSLFVCVGVCVSLSLFCVCVCVCYLCVSTRDCRHRSYTIGACRRNWEWRKGKNNESGTKTKTNCRYGSCRSLFKNHHSKRKLHTVPWKTKNPDQKIYNKRL